MYQYRINYGKYDNHIYQKICEFMGGLGSSVAIPNIIPIQQPNCHFGSVLPQPYCDSNLPNIPSFVQPNIGIQPIDTSNVYPTHFKKDNISIHEKFNNIHNLSNDSYMYKGTRIPNNIVINNNDHQYESEQDNTKLITSSDVAGRVLLDYQKNLCKEDIQFLESNMISKYNKENVNHYIKYQKVYMNNNGKAQIYELIDINSRYEYPPISNGWKKRSMDSIRATVQVDEPLYRNNVTSSDRINGTLIFDYVSKKKVNKATDNIVKYENDKENIGTKPSLTYEDSIKKIELKFQQENQTKLLTDSSDIDEDENKLRVICTDIDKKSLQWEKKRVHFNEYVMENFINPNTTELNNDFIKMSQLKFGEPFCMKKNRNQKSSKTTLSFLEDDDFKSLRSKDYSFQRNEFESDDLQNHAYLNLSKHCFEKNNSSVSSLDYVKQNLNDVKKSKSVKKTIVYSNKNKYNEKLVNMITLYNNHMLLDEMMYIDLTMNDNYVQSNEQKCIDNLLKVNTFMHLNCNFYSFVGIQESKEIIYNSLTEYDLWIYSSGTSNNNDYTNNLQSSIVNDEYYIYDLSQTDDTQASIPLNVLENKIVYSVEPEIYCNFRIFVDNNRRFRFQLCFNKRYIGYFCTNYLHMNIIDYSNK